VGPDYQRPAAPEPAKYKELKGWKVAAPNDAIDRGPWWTTFRDPTLNWLEPQVDVSNQTIIAAEAAYRQSLAVVKQAQAGLFPVVTADYSGLGSHLGSRISGAGVPTTLVTSAQAANATWEPDIWGKVRRTVESDAAAAQFSAAEVANARLSAQALLASAYFNLRAADALKALLDRTVVQFRKTLEITEHQYAAGTVSKADVATARAQVYNTQAQSINVGIARAQFEHAIAALIGKPPADLTIAPGALGRSYPKIPVSLPSTLLERRPDIAAAERQMQQQNALIGVAIAAYFPDVTLAGEAGFLGVGPLAARLGHDFWTLSAAATQILFDGGLRGAQIDAAQASFDQSVAIYRQTVLTAFQQVEDQLAALRLLAKQAKVEDLAVQAAQEEVDILLNQYRAGTVAFTAVVVAQATLLNNQQAALAIRQNRYLASVALIEALGGGWSVALLPSQEALELRNPLIPRL
jgi:NodT family efflux transporter outer membrane factor (OMF) lipoprotein